METSTNLQFYLPSSNTGDIAEINLISDNFRNLDELIPGLVREIKNEIREKQDIFQYELIETIEVTEPITVVRTEEPDGVPYNFKAMCIQIECNATDIPATGWTFIGNGVDVASFTISAFSNNATKQATFIETFIDKSWWRSNFVDWGYYQDNRDLRVPLSNAFLKKSEKDVPSITQLYQRGTLPAGTTIKIWGARA